MRLFSNRSQRMSKYYCGENKKVAHEAQPDILTSSVIYYWTTHGNMESICSIYNRIGHARYINMKYTYIHDHSPTGLFMASADRRDRPNACKGASGSRKRSWMIPERISQPRPDHNTGNFLFTISVEVLLRPLLTILTLKMQETGPTVYSPCPRRLESLTICWCNCKGSTFYSVILRPWALVRPELNSRPPARQPTNPMRGKNA